jgi:hypothetical protein
MNGMGTKLKPPISDMGRRLEHVRVACGYPTRAAFMRALGERPQSFTNWDERNTIGQARDKLRAVTGVSIDWMDTGEGVAFPSGPRMAGPSIEVQAADAAIAELQVLLVAMLQHLSQTPDAAAALHLRVLQLAHAAHLDPQRGLLRGAAELLQAAAGTRRSGLPQ